MLVVPGVSTFFSSAALSEVLRNCRGPAGFRAFQVGRVVALGAADDAVFAVGRRHHELVRGIAADGSALGFHRQIIQPAAGENPAVGPVHLLVDFIELREVRAEAVSVFHQKFARPQNAEPRAFLVAEFRLNLIQGQRQLAVALNVLGDRGR